MTRASLCSCSYNDLALLHGLLASVPGWNVQPDEIILLGDGSDPPFTLTEAEKALPIRLISHEQNLRFTRAKHDCISAARGDTILVMDCDARVSSDFLEICLSLLRDKSIDLLAPLAAPPVTDDYTSWYAYAFFFGRALAPPDDSLFGKNGNRPEKALYAAKIPLADAAFIRGNAFALRREVWEEVAALAAMPTKCTKTAAFQTPWPPGAIASRWRSAPSGRCACSVARCFAAATGSWGKVAAA